MNTNESSEPLQCEDGIDEERWDTMMSLPGDAEYTPFEMACSLLNKLPRIDAYALSCEMERDMVTLDNKEGAEYWAVVSATLEV